MKKFLSFESGDIFETENCYKLQKSFPEIWVTKNISIIIGRIFIIWLLNDGDKSNSIP